MKKRKVAKKRRVNVKKVKLPKAGVVQVVVPRGTIPVPVPGLDPRVMHVVPFPAEKVEKPQTWMDYFFGTDKY